MEIEVKKAKKKDYKKIAEIYQEAFSKPPYNEQCNLKERKKRIKILSKYCDIWNIQQKNDLIGFIIINPHYWDHNTYIFGEEMAIKEEYQRKGIGKKAITKLFNHYKTKGYKEYMGIVHEQSQSWGLHKKLGAKKSKYDHLMTKKL